MGLAAAYFPLGLAMNHEELLFLDETEKTGALPVQEGTSWKVLVVDDEPSVHDVTRLALRDFKFDQCGIELLHAYSGAEACTQMAAHPDVAVMLLDVVMETEHAGLDVVIRVRNELKNHQVRIVLRTGQPGAAPEEWVIARFDINDYKEKTELTSRKLFSLMHTALRGYRDLCIIEDNKRGLELIIESSANLFSYGSLDKLTGGVLEQLDALLHLRGAVIGRRAGGALAAVSDQGQQLAVVAATGSYVSSVGTAVAQVLPVDARERLAQCLDSVDMRHTLAWDDKLIGVFRASSGDVRVLFITGFLPKTEFDQHLIDLFLRNVGSSFENLQLHQEIEETQRELVYRLGGAVETRSRETANHVRRVAEMSQLLGVLCGLSPARAERLKHASPMHDVGKIGIPDAILNKPDRFQAEEWEVMKRHTVMGYELLKGSQWEILALGSVIALEHHEKWDGSGYPYGKSGEEIHLVARITALIDVFDALTSRRCYKEPWTLEAARSFIEQQSGKHFDPALVALFFANLDQFVAIRDRYPDMPETENF